jgi:phosphatidylserine/phosphatidylglycerophosphate/cardiolipin synthase-like enzyme
MVELALIEAEDAVWRWGRADRAAMLVDSAAYFASALELMSKAKRSITLLGWGFDPRTRLKPDTEGNEHGPDEIGRVLQRLNDERPELKIRLLIWKSALPVSASQHFFPHRAKGWFAGSPIRFELDATVPMGACHHQKVLIVDEAVAISGGGDICVDRWDSTAHLDHDPRRLMPGGECHDPRHEVMMMVDGEAARNLADLARLRWLRAVGEYIDPLDQANHDPWPAFVSPNFTGVNVGVARTEPRWRGDPGVREIETLHLQAIARAERCIYLENQYFTSPLIAEALVARLQEPDGPEVVLISTRHSPSWFDQATMDRTRLTLIERLEAADQFGRFRAFCPHTSKGVGIIVHSKVSIIDDEMLRAGSGNLNMRSAGFDTEVDQVIEAKDDACREAIRAFKMRLLAHHIGCSPATLEGALDEHGRLTLAIDAVNVGDSPRLRPMPRPKLGPLARLIAAFHLGDPVSPEDSWRPWARRKLLRRRVEALRPGLPAPGLRLSQRQVGEQRQMIGS